MKKLLTSLTIGASVLALTACNSGTDEVVIETDAGDITKEEFYQSMKEIDGDFVLSMLVEEKVLSDKYDVSDEEVEKAFEKAKSNFETDEEFHAALEQNGIYSEEHLKKNLRTGLLRQAAATDGVDTSTKTLQEYYDENTVNFTQLTASHILVEDEELAKDIKKQLDEGADFAELAKKHSMDSSAEAGGELGTFGKNEMVPAFDEVAFSLEEGEISSPVETDYGFHIIKVSKKETPAFKDIEEKVKDTYLSVNAAPLGDILTDLLKEADIKVKDDDFDDLFKELDEADTKTEDKDQADEK